MGGNTFQTQANGATADEAFNNAVKRAQYEYGHGGYSGTIAEKTDFVMIDHDANDEVSPSEHAEKLIDDDDPRISDKWGPAGCFDLGDGTFHFFGWASS